MIYVSNLFLQGNAAIHYCVSHGNFDIVGLLLDTEVCDVQRPNKAGYTPAMLASLAYVQNEEHREFIRTLFEVSDINAQAEQVGCGNCCVRGSCHVLKLMCLLFIGFFVSHGAVWVPSFNVAASVVCVCVCVLFCVILSCFFLPFELQMCSCL